MCESRLRLSIFLGALLLLVGPSVAFADRAEAVKQLVSRGGLKKRDARKVIGKVAARMAKSADNFAPADDALRVAFSQELFGTDVPPNRMKAAKVRLKLFAGPSSWALSALFGSGRGASCQREFGLSGKQCKALVVAGGGKPGAQASAKAHSPSHRPQAKPSVAPRAGKGKSRFARYDSGYRAKSKKTPAKASAAKSYRFSAKSKGPTATASRVAAKKPVITAAHSASTKNAYQARRKAYMERQKARLEARKSKLASRSRNAKVSRGVLPSQTAAAAPAESGQGDTMEFTADEVEGASSAPAPAAEPAQEQLSGDFLDGLLADPLGSE